MERACRVMVVVAWVSVAVAAACSNNPAPPPASAAPPLHPTDARMGGVTTISGFDPRSGMHLDDDAPGRPPPRTAPNHPGRPIEVTLRSTPPGASVAVDGVPIGPTPQLWEGTTGSEHEFTFTMPGHEMARYRFVPVTSGVVHARLDAIGDDNLDAGQPPDELIRPGFVPPPPPRTEVSPEIDAGAPLVAPDAATAPSLGPQP